MLKTKTKTKTNRHIREREKQLGLFSHAPVRNMEREREKEKEKETDQASEQQTEENLSKSIKPALPEDPNSAIFYRNLFMLRQSCAPSTVYADLYNLNAESDRIAATSCAETLMEQFAHGIIEVRFEPNT